MMGVLVQGMDKRCCTAQGASVCKSWYEIEVLRKALQQATETAGSGR
jgi:hypothetical protein